MGWCRSAPRAKARLCRTTSTRRSSSGASIRRTSRVPVMAGAGSNSTKEAIDLAQHAEKAGADAVLVVTPYYNKPTQEGLYQHYKAINDAIGIPIIIYNIPGRSDRRHVGRHHEAPLRACEHRGVKDATANMARVTAQRAAMGEDFNQLSGEDITALGFMVHGGHGCISVTSNVAPRLCAEFQAACLKRRFLCGAEITGQARAAAHRSVHRDEPRADQICAVAYRQVRQRAAPADGAGERKGAGCRPQGHGPRRPDQLKKGSPCFRQQDFSNRSCHDAAASGNRIVQIRERSMLEEFKKFAMRGNVVDLAVGVIIGAAFGAIVNSLVSDVVMPLDRRDHRRARFLQLFHSAVVESDGKFAGRGEKAGRGAGLGQFLHAGRSIF